MALMTVLLFIFNECLTRMVPKGYQKGVQIHITTYKSDSYQLENNMEFHEASSRVNSNKLVCSTCLNTKGTNISKKTLRVCPICQNNYSVNQNTNVNLKCTTKKREPKSVEPTKRGQVDISENNNKIVINTETDISQGLDLLNEVLTVFKSKKQELQKGKSDKSIVMKDVSTEIDNEIRANTKPELMLSKVFLCTIEANKMDENHKFTVVDCYQPGNFKNEYVINLKKHKSSSIPQMKMDELKYSWKEKTKAKDAVEEVKRMFATVNIESVGKKTSENNRPVTRNGPRVLPVVKTKTNNEMNIIQSCKCCQTSDHCLSSGDSFVKPERGHQTSLSKNMCDKCVYTLCCHYQKKHGPLICQNCQNVIEKCCKCEKHFDDRNCENFG